jgi:hypothetical protein
MVLGGLSVNTQGVVTFGPGYCILDEVVELHLVGRTTLVAVSTRRRALRRPRTVAGR